MLRVTLLSCGPMTQDSGDFGEVERLFGAIERMLRAAWGQAHSDHRPVDNAAAASVG